MVVLVIPRAYRTRDGCCIIFIPQVGNLDLQFGQLPCLSGPVKGRRQRFLEAEELFLRNLRGCQTVLWDPHELIAGGSMTDEYAFRYAPKDVKAASTYICLESGQAADVTSVKMIHLAVLQSLHHLGMVQNVSKAGLSEGLLAWQHFEIAERFSLDQRGFQWVNGHGAYNFQVVPPGEVYGVRGEEKLRAPEGREPLGLKFSASCQESDSYSDYIGGFYCCDCYFNIF